jgi:DeoR/GlpR family transcriptional regulator of sugar metabolism
MPKENHSCQTDIVLCLHCGYGALFFAARQAVPSQQIPRPLFISCITAIDFRYGHSCASQAEAQVKKMLVTAGKQRIGLVDHTKFGKQVFVHVGPVTDFTTIITDSGADPDQIAGLREAGVEAIVVDVDKKLPNR